MLLDFLLQVTAFVALIVFDFLRAEDKRVDCFPCLKSSSYADSEKGEVSLSHISYRVMHTLRFHFNSFELIMILVCYMEI